MTTRDTQNAPGDLVTPAYTRVAYRHTAAGADYVPRRHIRTNKIHWFYEPRLRTGVQLAQTLCTGGHHSSALFMPNSELSEDLNGGEPCEKCDVRWMLPIVSAER